jgi:hypothetical protein
MSDKLAITKLVVNVAAGMGVSKVVNDIITNNTTIETTADAVKVWAGSVVIGSMVADAGSKHVNAKIDSVANWYEARKEAKNDKNEYKSNR